MVPLFKILDPGYFFLGVGYHFCEEVGEAGATELGGAGAVEVSVVDGFAVRWGAEAGLKGASVGGLR